MEKFLKKCVIHALEYQAQEPGLKLGTKLKNFKDILIQDSTIIRLNESLAKLWPAARSKKIAAGLKLSCVVSAVADGVKAVRLFSERTAEVKTLRLGSWLKDRILLTDLGFFNYNSFDKIERYGGFFVSRLKGNANPTIVRVNKICRGNSIDVVGKKLKDVLPLLKRQLLDVVVEVEVKRRKYKGKNTKITRTFRLVCVLNEETEEYHVYLTNIPIDILIGEDIADLYSARWDIEEFHRGIKQTTGIEKCYSTLASSQKTHIFASFVAFIKLEIRRLKEHISWYEQKATINRCAVSNYLRTNA